jgi:type IX secretion system substrate protein
MKRINLILTILFFTITSTVFGQGWERTFGGTDLDMGYSVLQTPNGDFIACGYAFSFGDGVHQEIHVVRTDIDGNTIWEQTHSEDNIKLYGQSLIETSDGNYLIAGYQTADNGDQNLYLLKIDPDGSKIWANTIESPGVDFGYQVIETIDNGFAIIGETRDSLSGQRDTYFSKTDINGNEEWNKRIGDVLYDAAFSVIQNPNEDYIIAGYQTTITPSDTTREAVLIQTNSTGDPLNTFSLGETVLVSGAEVIAATGGGYITAVYNDFTVFLKKVSTGGVVEWSKEIPDFNILVGSSLVGTPDGGYALAGSFRESGQNQDDLKIIKTDDQGEIEWNKTHGSPIGDDIAFGICNAQGEGFGVIGYTTSFGAGSRDYYLLMTDSLGNTLNNFVTGNVYYDLDEGCDLDAGEYGLHNWLLEVAGENTYYGLTDEDGNYQIAVESGDYTLNLIPLNDYWQSCDNNYNLSLSGPYDTTTVDFPLQALYDCPLLEVDISTPFLRRCFDNIYTVSYCNDGTILAENVQIEVELDEFLTVNNSTNSNYSNIGNTYIFDIEDLDVGECGEFYIDVTVDCDSTILGQTHCVEAHITPDSICTPPQQCWDGGSIELDASCEGDSVRFTIRNVGTAATTAALNYIIVEDHIILLTNPIGGEILPAQDTVIVWPVDGQTLRIEVDQEPCHPGNSTPTVTVEGCGQVDPMDVSLGYLTQYYQDDSNPFVSIDCQENIGSWDPNDKRGFPKGYENPHYIEANRELDYIIRFQNTGSDTAFRVVIRDTLSEWLNIRDIQVGASSHVYDYEIYGENILKFTFENINLPDSTTNEVASHGFIKFRIAQQLDNPSGTVIPNSAGIYFDYNVPVITNETWHTIGENFIEVVSNINVFVPGVQVNFYPNPFTQQATFEITYDDGTVIPDFETKTFNLFDTQGRLIRSETFEGNRHQFLRKGLTTGLYFFQIETKNKLIIGGKLIAH